MNVYWSREGLNPLIEDKPEFLMKSDEWKKLGLYTKCYSSTSFFKNTVILKSPFVFTLGRNKTEIYTRNQPQDWFDKYINCQHINDNTFQLEFKYYFFTEEDLEVSLIPPTLHKNEYTNKVSPLSGKMNISKWFRPLQPAFAWTKEEDEINVNFGDALNYIQFHTDKKINLKQFNWTPKLEEYTNLCTTVKFQKPYLNLTKVYERFKMRNMNKLIMKEIRNNLVE